MDVVKGVTGLLMLRGDRSDGRAARIPDRKLQRAVP